MRLQELTLRQCSSIVTFTSVAHPHQRAVVGARQKPALAHTVGLLWEQKGIANRERAENHRHGLAVQDLQPYVEVLVGRPHRMHIDDLLYMSHNFPNAISHVYIRWNFIM